MMEHIVLHYLNEKLDKILHNRQHGFRKGKHSSVPPTTTLPNQWNLHIQRMLSS